MARNRKRTWTALERTIMKWFKVQGHQSPIWIIEAAEKIIRTKGVVAKWPRIDDPVDSPHYVQMDSRFPDEPFRQTRNAARITRMLPHLWTPDPNNPNILTR